LPSGVRKYEREILNKQFQQLQSKLNKNIQNTNSESGIFKKQLEKIQDKFESNQLSESSEVRENIVNTLGMLQRVEQRLRASQLVLQWLDDNQEILVKVAAQYAIDRDYNLAKSDGSTDSLEKVEQFYEDINKYMLWLYYSLTRGLPLEVNITPTLPISAYVAAFKFIKQELIIGKLPDDVAKELIIYLDYLIERFFP
jgi:hypothetical protein